MSSDRISHIERRTNCDLLPTHSSDWMLFQIAVPVSIHEWVCSTVSTCVATGLDLSARSDCAIFVQLAACLASVEIIDEVAVPTESKTSKLSIPATP